MKLVNILSYLGSLFLCISMYAQDAPFQNSKQYTLGEITVTGTTSFNDKTIKAYAGLNSGQKVYLPGDKISTVINKLWKLGLFKDVNIYVTNINGDIADIEININQLPLLNEVRIDGVSKTKAQDFISENKLTKGTKVTENIVTTTRNRIRDFYKEKGYLNTKVLTSQTDVVVEGKEEAGVNLLFKVFTGEKVKINEIHIHGNEALVNKKVLKQLKKTKKKMPLRFWKRSKYINEDYEEGKLGIIEKYKEKGYRDARILKDSIAEVADNLIDLHINVEEGNKYYFGNITFLGNSVYSDEELQRKLVLKKGDVYNGVLLEKRISDNESPDADDITNLYQNNGYFFSRINAVETNVHNDSIDFEIRINEGKLAHFNNITVSGNDKTNDHVVFRNIRTLPGEVYSKEKLIRTIRELGQTNFFDTEQLVPSFKNIDQNQGTIDVDYSVVEKGASQFELQGGYGGTGLIGTLGLSFNNFSVRNIFNGKSYRPLPSGDGQSLSIRAQRSQTFQTYSLSFIEPWLGGKKPVQFSFSLMRTKQFNFNFTTAEVDKNQSFLLSGGSIGLAKRLRWPDDYFTFSQTLGVRHYNLQNFNTGLFTFGDGEANDISYSVGLSRDNTSTNPIYPTGGSKINLSLKASLPYSRFGNTDWDALLTERNEAIEESEGVITDEISAIDQQRFKWLEYYKLKFSGDWYTSLTKKFVFKSSFQFGFLGAYNQSRGLIPFERFQLGGSGLGGRNSGVASLENIALRGYPDAQVVSASRDIDAVEGVTAGSGAPIYNKFSLELRYPLSFNPTATIYALTFVEGGAAFDNFKQFNPFAIKRSAGAGIRVFMPAFGLLGIDFAYGFDPLTSLQPNPNGWETHFILGQQF